MLSGVVRLITNHQSSAPSNAHQKSGPFPPLALPSLASVGSEEARSIALTLASVRRSNWTCSFPASSFHEAAVLRAAMEGIIPTKLTSPYSP